MSIIRDFETGVIRTLLFAIDAEMLNPLAGADIPVCVTQRNNTKRRLCRPGMRIAVFLALLVCSSCGSQPVEVEILMRDGTRLPTDFYFPDCWFAHPDLPTLLVRTPYGKENMRFLGRLSEQGVVVAVQDMRMREGVPPDDFYIFRTDGWGELQDGYDTVRYIRSRFWSNNVVVTRGASALGIVQYLLAGVDNCSLSGQVAAVATPDLYSHMFFPGGVFRKHDIEMWIARRGYLQAQRDAIIESEILAHPAKEEYWEEVNLKNRLSFINSPALHLGGWYDLHCQGTIDAFHLYEEAAVEHNYLIMGPWIHAMISDEAALEAADNMTELIYWTEQWWETRQRPPAELFIELALQENLKAFDWPRVSYYVMGSDNQTTAGNWWCHAETWPPENQITEKLYLAPGKKLLPDPPEQEALTYVYNPLDPLPTLCGRYLDAAYAGSCDLSARYDIRPDVLYFETEPLSSPLEITGRVKLCLEIVSDRPDTDFSAFLVDVYPGGRKMLVCDGIVRARYREGFDHMVELDPYTPAEVVVDLWSTSFAFGTGHRIGLYVSSSNAPGFETNPNAGISADGSEGVPATNTVLTGEGSYLLLPTYPEYSCEPYKTAGDNEAAVKKICP